MKFVKLTELDGKPREWIMPSWVVVVSDAFHESLPTAKTRIILSGATVFVLEEPEEVVRLVEEAL